MNILKNLVRHVCYYAASIWVGIFVYFSICGLFHGIINLTVPNSPTEALNIIWLFLKTILQMMFAGLFIQLIAFPIGVILVAPPFLFICIILKSAEKLNCLSLSKYPFYYIICGAITGYSASVLLGGEVLKKVGGFGNMPMIVAGAVSAYMYHCLEYKKPFFRFPKYKSSIWNKVKGHIFYYAITVLLCLWTLFFSVGTFLIIDKYFTNGIGFISLLESAFKNICILVLAQLFIVPFAMLVALPSFLVFVIIFTLLQRYKIKVLNEKIYYIISGAFTGIYALLSVIGIGNLSSPNKINNLFILIIFLIMGAAFGYFYHYLEYKNKKIEKAENELS